MWVEGYRRAWEERDPAAAAALFTDDAEYRSMIFEEPHRGHDGVAGYWETVTSQQADVRVLMGRPFVDGDRVAVEFWTTMLSNGDPVTLTGCMLLDFEGALCSRLREYYHFAPGQAEPPAGWGQ